MNRVSHIYDDSNSPLKELILAKTRDFLLKNYRFRAYSIISYGSVLALSLKE